MARQHQGGATIVDVARAAGVSVSTVSRVMRDHADVGALTRSRVREAIGVLNYRPSPIARALVAGRSRLLTLLVNDIANPFYPELAKAVEQEASRERYSVVFCNTADRTKETSRYVESLLSQGLDGVIHASVARDEKVLLSLIGDERRIVFVNRPPAQQGVSYVVGDNRGGAAELTRHLLSLKHLRIGFIKGPKYARNASERLKGFLAAMNEVTGAEPILAQGDFSVESGRRAVSEWIKGNNLPTAIIAVTDEVALGALEVLRERQRRVPEDVALAGFDGTRLSASPLIALTTVDQHIELLGRRSVQILLKQLTDTENFVPVQEVLPTQLLVRRSSVGLAQGRRSIHPLVARSRPLPSPRVSGVGASKS